MNIHEVKAHIRYNIIWRIKAFLHFFRLAFLMLIGKLGVMDGDTVTSKGGYYYFSYIISPLPVTKDKDRMLNLMHEQDPEEEVENE